jgi:hypothetical protein
MQFRFCFLVTAVDSVAFSYAFALLLVGGGDQTRSPCARNKTELITQWEKFGNFYPIYDFLHILHAFEKRKSDVTISMTR